MSSPACTVRAMGITRFTTKVTLTKGIASEVG